MTKWELIEKYNYYVRKRECFKAKVQANASLKQSVVSEYATLTSNMNSLAAYEDCSVLFGELYTKNKEMFSSSEASRIAGIFDSIDGHLNGVIASCQQSINYYDAEIRRIEEEEREEERRKEENAGS